MSDERSSHRRGSVYKIFEGRFQPNPQLLAPSLASSIGSFGRSSTTTTAPSEIFSQAHSSVTSASVYSRPPSILQGSLPNFAPRAHGSVRDRKRFRDKLRIGLTCLLLSDLGSLVWSWGCETDTWLSQVQNDSTVMNRMSTLLSSEGLRLDGSSLPKVWSQRRNSGSEAGNAEQSLEVDANFDGIDYVAAMEDAISRISQQIDPVGKLKACVEFDALALQQLESLSKQPPSKTGPVSATIHMQRSLSESNAAYIKAERSMQQSNLQMSAQTDAGEQRTVLHYKRQLAKLRPATLFRDLQYIAVFTPPEMLDKTAAGKALMRLGVAALEYKKDLCSSLVNVAGKVMIADSIKRVNTKLEPSLSQVAGYWKIAAVEGNRVAQRELALMYLMHSEMLSIITLPLSAPSKIFQDDMMWQKTATTSKSRQALCLALHWMQQAAKEGDQVAQQKLLERDGELSLQ